MSSKAFNDRIKAARFLEEGLETQTEEVAAAIDETFGSVIRPGEVAPDGATLLRILRRLVANARHRFEAADEARHFEALDDDSPRRERDEAAAELYRLLVGLGRIVDNVFGRGRRAEIVGLEGRLRRDAAFLEHQAAETLGRLRSLSLADEPGVPGMTFDADAWADELEPVLERLAAARVAVALERREKELADDERRRAHAELDALYSRVGRLSEALYELVGEKERARRLRPRSRRTARRRAAAPAPPEASAKRS